MIPVPAGFRLDVYEARDGWRWRVKARNGRIIAESGEAYTRERDAERAFGRLLDLLADEFVAVVQNAPTSERIN